MVAWKAVAMHNFVSCLWLHSNKGYCWWSLSLLLSVNPVLLQHSLLFKWFILPLSVTIRNLVLSFQILVPVFSVETLQALAHNAP